MKIFVGLPFSPAAGASAGGAGIGQAAGQLAGQVGGQATGHSTGQADRQLAQALAGASFGDALADAGAVAKGVPETTSGAAPAAPADPVGLARVAADVISLAAGAVAKLGGTPHPAGSRTIATSLPPVAVAVLPPDEATASTAGVASAGGADVSTGVPPRAAGGRGDDATSADAPLLPAPTAGDASAALLALLNATALSPAASQADGRRGPDARSGTGGGSTPSSDATGPAAAGDAIAITNIAVHSHLAPPSASAAVLDVSPATAGSRGRAVASAATTTPDAVASAPAAGAAIPADASPPADKVSLSADVPATAVPPTEVLATGGSATASPAAPDAAALPVVRAIAGSITALAAQAAAPAAGSAATTAALSTAASVPGPARTLTLQLSPANLGTVDVRLHVTGQTLDVELALTDRQTLGLVSRERDTLATALREGGYDLHSLVIQSADGMAATANQPGSDRPGADRQDAPRDGGSQGAGGGSQMSGGRGEQRSTSARPARGDPERSADNSDAGSPGAVFV